MPTFGVARQYGKDIESLLLKLNNSNIDAYEIGFVYGIPQNFNYKIKNIAEKYKIKLSAHLPFYISWKNKEKIMNSINHLSQGVNFSLKLSTIAVFHLGFYGGKSYRVLKPKITSSICESIKLINNSLNLKQPVLGIETTGKTSEIGTLDEVIDICKTLTSDLVIPILDWAHIFARSNGKIPKSSIDFKNILDRIENELGIKNFYFHGSGVEYKNGQEKKHLSVKTCSPPLPYLFSVLNDHGYDYKLIVESPDAIKDTLWLKEVSKNPKKWFDYTQKSLINSMKSQQKNLIDFF